MGVLNCHPRLKYPINDFNFTSDKLFNFNMNSFNCITLFSLLVLCRSIRAAGTITVTATPYEALPFPEGFKCLEKGVFPHRVHCNKYWLCQENELEESEESAESEESGESEESLKGAELYQCPEGYLFDRTINFCNNAEDVECSTLGTEKLAKALDIMKETQRLEKKLKEIEKTLKDLPKRNTESDPINFESSNDEKFVAESSDSLISLIFRR